MSVLFSGPESDLRPRAARSSACQEHTNLHNRMDVVEKVQLPFISCQWFETIRVPDMLSLSADNFVLLVFLPSFKDNSDFCPHEVLIIVTINK